MTFHPVNGKTGGVGYQPNARYFSCPNPDYINHQDLAGRIDPLLQYSTPHSSQQSLRHGTNSMQRYLQEPQNNYFTAPPSVALPNAQYTGIYPDMGSPLHRSSQFRHGSPTSYQPSSAASGPQSPPWTDNDVYGDSTQGPSTPSDIAVLSPNIVCSGSQSPSVSLYGLSNAPQECVNPAAIEPNHSFPDIHGEEELGSFTLDLNADFDSVTPNSFCQDRGSSPAPTSITPPSEPYSQDHLKESYPEFERMDLDTKVEDCIEASDDGDGEYKPNSRTKSSQAPKGGSRRSRTKQSSSSANPNRAKITKPQPPPRAAGARRFLSSSSSGNTMCAYCQKSFPDGVSLQKHINAIHSRPFVCVFHFAGCNKAFANKNEWKRHVSAQHLNLHYWSCTTSTCGYSQNPSKGILGDPTHCRVFKRKDLYTQHIRRMHAPADVARADKKDKSFPHDWIVQEKTLQEEAFRQRCRLPDYMHCPAEGCTAVFNNGHKTWDNRMEHVAVHLERAANNEEPQVMFGGANDKALTEWASHPSVRVIVATTKGWELCQPLKAAKTELSRLTSVNYEGLDEDAEGEEC
ncbi:PR domain zinc finger protein 10 [Fusarium austroafricanum]|uniref:PR domain zinc finger protein 10 n=1 Tax=Fusarium austroafricanum TaxID=2364996 RepID=A0A8H4NHW4_9HYPO|nr:PR domain zinc finger protein 10 [Fusarium austroafricanum]